MPEDQASHTSASYSRRHSETRARSAFAAVDLGTNNCRLLVARPTERGFRVVDAFSRIVRLGEGVATTGRFSDEAMDRSIDALRIVAAKLRRYPGVRSRCVATEACRRAENSDVFVDRVRNEVGLALEVISPAEEAGLALAGCAPLLEPDRPHALVFDIGGGSTEVIWRDAGSSRPESLSIPFGVVNVAERHGSDARVPGIYELMVEEAYEHLTPFEAEHRVCEEIARGTVQMLGTSGTVTTLASIHLGLRRYDRNRVDGCHLSFDNISQVTGRLRQLDIDGRAGLSCVGRERADLVLAGAAILEAICRLWPVGRLRVADRGLREGILLGLMASQGRRRRRRARSRVAV